MSVQEEVIAEWKRVSLASLSAFITKGTTPTTYGFRWEAFGVLFLRSECVSDHGLDLTQSMFISAAAHNSLHRSQVLPNDLLVTITGNVGRVVMFEGADAANLNQHIARVRITDPQANSRFIYHWLSQESVRRHFISITTGQAYPQISLVQVRNAEVLLPPLEQQVAIAAALSDADALLAGLDRLIAKKRDLKQAAMQQLLTGKTRLPGFLGEWEVKRLGDIFQIAVGTSKSAFITENGDYWICDMGSVSTTGKLIVSKRTNYRGDFLAAGDLIMPKDDIGGGNIIGRVGYIDSDGTYVLSDHVYHLRAVGGDSRFLAYAINSYRTNRELRKKVIGSAQLGLGRKSVTEQEVQFPPVNEQTAIAAVLTDMGAELTALEARRDKTRALKQGMMQEILTGRTRLV